MPLLNGPYVSENGEYEDFCPETLVSTNSPEVLISMLKLLQKKKPLIFQLYYVENQHTLENSTVGNRAAL